MFPGNREHRLCPRTPRQGPRFMLTGRDHVTCELDAVPGKRQFLGLIRVSWTVLLDPHLESPPIEVTAMCERNLQTTDDDYFNLFFLDFLFHIM